MHRLNKRITALFSVILCTVLGIMLILSEPAFAITLIKDVPFELSEKQAYKVEVSDSCNASVQLTFDTVFEEIYPIKKGWPLFFNTPIYTDTDPIPGSNESDDDDFYTQISSGSVTNVSDCTLTLTDNQQLELLSGFKGNDENDDSGHFVVAKDYYADIDGDGSYSKYLGSLTSAKAANASPALGGVTVAQLIIAPSSIRAPHWHLQWVETGYCYHGLGQVGVIVPGNVIPNPDFFMPESPGSDVMVINPNEPRFINTSRVEEIFIKPQEIFIFPQGSQHYLRNIGTEADGNLACTLFFADGVPLNEDELLTITLQNLVGSTPRGVLDSVLVMPPDGNPAIPYTSELLTSSPAQTYSSVEQANNDGNIVPVKGVPRGENPATWPE
ncbi:MAG: cupin domain-containing protein [Xenococcus sp. (in: cyanobacteria)]